jgi:4-amino-4-deoxy-L-arabinose transferase-like glycosyltransferase
MKKHTFLKTVFDKYLLLFGLGIILSSGFWFGKVTAVHGKPIFLSKKESAVEKQPQTVWRKTVTGRPPYTYLAGIPYQNPLFALAYLVPFWLWFHKKNTKKTLILLLFSWLVVFLLILSKYVQGIEHRYMLPAYPAYAVLGAFILNDLRSLLNKAIRFHVGDMVCITVLIASLYWSLPLAYEILFCNGALIMKPF